MKAKDFLLFILQAILLGVLQTAGIVLGFLIVPVMLTFGKFDKNSEVPFTDHTSKNKWIREVFPKLFWPWDNVEDSSVGDTRGWWDANCFGADSRRWINRFWWLAVRNPFNNFKRYIIGCDVRKYTFSLLAGKDKVRDDFENTGWQVVKATPKSGVVPRYMFYWVKRYGASNRALVVQIGNKIKVSHNDAVEANEIDYFKGFTIEINPFKDIS